MTLHRPSKPHKLLPTLLLLLALPHLTRAQITSFFPSYLTCLNQCQPLLSANYDCTLSGQSDLDCLCQSRWVEQFYDGSTCTCTSDYEAQEFKNWFQGTNGCSPYVEARIRSSETSTPTSTVESSSSSTEETTTTESTSTSRRTTSSIESTTTSESSSTTTDSTLTTSVSTTTNTRGDQETSTTPSPTSPTSTSTASASFIDQNKSWFIPTVTLGSLIVLGASVFAFLFFCCGICRRSGRGRYAKAHNPSLAATAAAAAAAGPVKRKKNGWFSSLPFFGVGKSSGSDGSGDTLVGDSYDPQYPYRTSNSMVDTGYYGAGAGLMGPGYVPYQHGAPLPPIDEVQSIAESTMTRDRGLSQQNLRSPTRGIHDDDEPFDFGYGQQQGVASYSPVGNTGGMVLPPMPVVQQQGGFIGSAVTTGIQNGGQGSGGRRESGDMNTFSNRYEDLTDRRMDRRMFDPFGNPMPMDMMGMPIMIPRKEVRSNPTTPVVEPNRSSTVSPPASTVSIASSSGFAGGGGPLAGRGGGQYPRPPAPAGSGLFSPHRRGDYYEDYR